MPENNNIDLSKLQIRRDEIKSIEQSSNKHSRLYFYLGGLLIIVIVLFFFFRTSFTPVEIVEITTATRVSSSQANALLTASGYVVAQRKAAIASKATGRLVYLGYEEGDKVNKGDIIGKIENADVNAALAQAKANLEINQADLNDAERSLNRAKTLFASNLISQSELDAVQARYDRVIATIASAKAGVNAAEVQVENTLIRAPFDGTILTKNADVGEVVSPFSAGATSRVAVVTIADMNSLEVEADVSESNIEKISVKQPCEITLDAYPDQRYRGFVNKIVPTADRSKATVLTKIKFVDKDNRVLPEMSAKINFLSAPITDKFQAQPKLVVTSSAIATRNGKQVVFLFSGNEVSEITVEIGDKMGNMIEIKSGLSAGDKVVVKPSEQLKSGAKVKLKE
jgi:RND family efflux transporter MFP subunit